MAGAARDALIRLISAYRKGLRLALLFDYDGTLTPIVAHPALARLEPQTRGLLERLAQQPGVHVGVLSGRGLENVRAMVGLAGLYYAGNAGMELDLCGQNVTHPEARTYRHLLRTSVRCLGEIAGAYPGAWVEDKRLGLTLHYRHVALYQRDELLARAGEALRAHAPRLRVVEGPQAWEITPKGGWDKGAALRCIVDTIGPPVLPVYAGDAANDVEACVAATALDGLALWIGAGAPASAPYRLQDPAALTNFLTCLVAALDPASAAPVA